MPLKKPVRNDGRRLHDKKRVKVLYLFVALFIGHFVTKKFPQFDLLELGIEIAEYVNTIIDAIGGIAVLTLLFTIFKYFKKDKS